MPETDADPRIPTVESLDGKKGDFDLAPDVDRLPVRIVRNRSRGVGVAAMSVVGSLSGLWMCLMEDHRAPEGERWPLVLIMLGVSLIPGIILAVRALTLKTSWTFYPDRVAVRERWLLRRKAWTEQLAAYKGVLAEHRRRESGGKGTRTCVLTLLHAHAKRRTIELYCSGSAEGLRAKQAHYALLFGVPGLIETESGVEERAPEDVGRSVRERVAAGTLAASFDPAAKPAGRRLTVRAEGQALVLRVRRALGLTGVAAPVLLGAPGLALGAASFALHAPTGLRTMAIVFLAAAALAAVGLNVLAEELHVSPHHVRKCWRLPWGGELRTEEVRAEDVTDVFMARRGGARRGRTVQIVADARVLHFGGALGRAAKRWARDCIIAVISK